MEVHEIEYGSPEYQAALKLRNQLLRLPIGLDVFDEPLEEERGQWHYGLFNGSQLIGSVVAVPKSTSHAKIRQMAIDESRQDGGLGRQLLSTVERRLAERGIETVELAARTPVTGFYEKLGYEQVGGEFIEVDIPHVEMRKQLS